jgi:hypothetical protein
LTLAAGAFAGVVLFLARSLRAQALALSAASALLITTVTVQCQYHLYRFYDLAPLATAIQPYKGGPLAFAGQYAGEIGYLARLARPVEAVPGASNLTAWFEHHPDGTAILRHRKLDELKGFSIVRSQPFRTRNLFSVVRRKPEPRDPPQSTGGGAPSGP